MHTDIQTGRETGETIERKRKEKKTQGDRHTNRKNYEKRKIE